MVQQDTTSSTPSTRSTSPAIESPDPLWTWRELCQILHNPIVDGPDVDRVHTDSRTTKSGDLFVALPGDPGPRFNASYRSNVDGHDYVQNALSQGAVAALVHKSLDLTAPCVNVADTYDALWQLGHASALRMSGTRFAITGSSGKTTAKSYLAAALNAYSAPGSFNNHLGVPLALSNMPRSTRFGVFEVGTNHPGEILPLAELVQPHVAIVLNVGMAHIENFTSQEALQKEKLSIFDALQDPENAVWEDSLQYEKGFSFGRQPGADSQIMDLSGDQLTLNLFGQRLVARVPGGGIHRAATLAAIILAIKVADSDIQASLDLSPELIPKGRGNEVQTSGGVTLIDDSYNANPASMAAAIAALVASDGNRKVAILGEMLELGTVAESAHETLLASASDLDEVICVGSGFEKPAGQRGMTWYPEIDEKVLDQISSCLAPGDRVLIKGSNRVFWQHDFVERLCQKLD